MNLIFKRKKKEDTKELDNMKNHQVKLKWLCLKMQVKLKNAHVAVVITFVKNVQKLLFASLLVMIDTVKVKKC